MKLVKKILGKLSGLHYHQEYLCTPLETFKNQLHVYLVSRDNIVIKDVSTEHLFIGYKPVVIAISLLGDDRSGYMLLFTNKSFDIGVRVPALDIIASLAILHKGSFTDEVDTISYFVAVKGHHRFLNGLNKMAMSLSNRWFNNRPGNVYLEGNLYHQVHIAYSIPRKISLVTVRCGTGYNLFPTDLHGTIQRHYIISLRKEGRACAQVQEAGKILLSDMDIPAFKQVYALGKNHMQECKSRDAFSFSSLSSPNYNLPVPMSAIGLKELKLIGFEDVGIHRLLFFRIETDSKVPGGEGILSHIHNTYATWRYSQKIATSYFMR